MKRGQRLESTVIYDNTTLEDIRKVIIAWQYNPNGVPPAVCEDPNTHKLNICDIDVTLWVKAMVPSDKKEFWRFWDLMFEVLSPTNGTRSLLGIDLQRSVRLRKPRALSLRQSVVECFACPMGKTIGQVNAYDVSEYLRTHVGLTWEWIQEWICPYIKWSHQGLAYNMAARLVDQHQKEKEEKKLLDKAWALAVKDYLTKVLPIEEALEIVKAARKKIGNLPRRSLADCIASKPAMMTLASHLTKPMAVAFSSSVTLDDVPSQVAAPLPYDDSGVPARDIPMDESMEALDLNQAPELEEVEMLDISHSPRQCKDWEDYNEPMNELDPSR
jgi:hypothetical protein